MSGFPGDIADFKRGKGKGKGNKCKNRSRPRFQQPDEPTPTTSSMPQGSLHRQGQMKRLSSASKKVPMVAPLRPHTPHTIPRVYPLDYRVTSALPASILDGPMVGESSALGFPYPRLPDEDVAYVTEELRKWAALASSAPTTSPSPTAGSESTLQQWQRLSLETMEEFQNNSEARIATTLVSNTRKGDDHHAQLVVANYQRAYRWLRSDSGSNQPAGTAAASSSNGPAQPFSSSPFFGFEKARLCELHRFLMEGLPLREGAVGVYRSSQAAIGKCLLFPSADEVHELMEEFLQSFNRLLQRTDITCVAVAAYFFHEFLCIHPFHDGNGRMARLLCDFIFWKYGKMPFPVNLCMSDWQRRELTAALRTTNNTDPAWAARNADARSGPPPMVAQSYCPRLRRLIWHLLRSSFTEYGKMLQKKEQRKAEQDKEIIIRQSRENLRDHESCTICLEGGVNLNLLCCGACYHFDCLLRWLGTQPGGRSSAESSCAACRQIITNQIGSVLDDLERRRAEEQGDTMSSDLGGDTTDTTPSLLDETTTTSSTPPSSTDGLFWIPYTVYPPLPSEADLLQKCRECFRNQRARGCVLECCQRCCIGAVRRHNIHDPSLGLRCERHSDRYAG